MTFNLGDTVEWISQSQGRSRTKRGIVVEVVPGGCDPQEGVTTQTFYTGPRKNESYVVRIGTKTYWPIASTLEPVEEGARWEKERVA